MVEPFWIDPAVIRFKIAPSADLAGVRGGDWDLDRRHALPGTLKFQAIRERFTDGRPWEDTALFRDIYARRFAEGQTVRGAATLQDLVAQYYDRVDGLHDSMAREGFKLTAAKNVPVPLPCLYIGRDGEVFIGNQGNHRLAIAQVLGLNQFAGRILCRHKKAPR